MRKYITFLSLTLLFFLSSCSKEEDIIWDIQPLFFQVEVVDQLGNNLMDPAHEKNLLNSGITATFMGKTYELHAVDDTPQTRAYLPIFYGLVYQQDYTGKYILFFGELDGTKSYKNETLVIDWKDGTTSELKVDYRFKWKGNKPKIKEKIWYKGEEVKRTIKIVK